MVELVDKILLHHGFIKKEDGIEFGSFYSKVGDSHIAYYWLVVDVENIESVLDKQDDWFNDCKEKYKLPDFNKNTSLLVLNKYKEDFKAWKKKVYKLEEDPYQFKKYVLRYTDEIVTELKERSINGNTQKLIELMSNEEIFNSYKQNHKIGEYSWLDLLYGLANKLPFLMLSSEKAADLGNLLEETKKRLDEQGLLAEYESLESKFNESVLSTIDDIELEELLTILKSSKDE